MTDALTTAKYIRDNAMRLVEANAAGNFTIEVSCYGNFCSSYTSGFKIRFKIYDHNSTEAVYSDSLESAVAEVLRRRAVKERETQIQLPPYERKATPDTVINAEFTEVARKEDDDDGVPF